MPKGISRSGKGPAPSGIVHYQARKDDEGWYFTSPTGEKTGSFAERFDCLRQAANCERADRHKAATSTNQCPRVKALRDHFFPDGLPTPAAVPLDLRPHHGG